MPTNNLEPPSTNKKDRAYTVVNSLLASIPGAGGALSVLFSDIVPSSVERRKQKWMENVADKLQRMEKQIDDFKIENLAKNEAFVTTLLQASQIAFRNHQEEKLEALKNAVANSALPEAPETDLQLMFLRLVDELTVSHINLLSFFNNPQQWCSDRHINEDTNEEDFLDVILPKHSSIEGKQFYTRIVIDLQEKGLLNSLNDSQKRIDARQKLQREQRGDRPTVEKVWSQEQIDLDKFSNLVKAVKFVRPSGVFKSFITGFGKSFLKFLSSPIETV